MTPTPCFDPADLHDVHQSAADSAERGHARECPRCGALLAEYTLYLSMRSPAEGANPDDADRKLRTFLRRELGAPAGAPATSEPPHVAHTLSPQPARSEGWLQQLFAPTWKPVLALAAVAIAVAAVLIAPLMRPHDDRDRLRGAGDGGGPRVEWVRIERDEAAARLAWAGFPGADAYEVRFFTRDLREVARIAVGPDTVRSFDATELPEARGTALVVRVVALAGGDVIATSPARPLELSH